MFASSKIKYTVVRTKQKLDEKARVFALVRNEEAAGANPAESTFFPKRNYETNR